jgi:ribosomal protein S18 acetylase RimI-like enzyme
VTAFYPEGNAGRRAIAVLRDEGLKSFWFKLASELGYRRLLLLERPLAQSIPELEPAVPLRIDTLKPSEVDDHLAFRPEMARACVLDRLRSAQVCFVARHESRIVSACWATTQTAWVEFLACGIAAAVGEVYLFDAFTLPDYRGQRAAPALCTHQLKHFQRAGVRRAIRATLPENVPALRAHAKCGFISFALIRRLRIGPWQCVFQRPCQSRGALALA